MLLAICTTRAKKESKKGKQKKGGAGGGGVMRNLLPGDSNLDFPNQLELKVNGSIQYTGQPRKSLLMQF